VIGAVFSNSREVLDSGPERPHGKNVGDRVASLVCWAQDGVGWTRRAFRIAGKGEQSKFEGSSVDSHGIAV
jgi:hypothetical protein